jgi:hypothetical protein
MHHNHNVIESVHHVPHTPTYWPLDLPVMMPRVSLGTCCGSSPKVGLGPWLTAGGVGIDTALVRAASSHCTPTHCESMLGLDSIMQVLHSWSGQRTRMALFSLVLVAATHSSADRVAFEY